MTRPAPKPSSGARRWPRIEGATEACVGGWGGCRKRKGGGGKEGGRQASWQSDRRAGRQERRVQEGERASVWTNLCTRGSEKEQWISRGTGVLSSAAPPPPPPLPPYSASSPPSPPPPRCRAQAYQLLGHVEEARHDLVTAATVEVGQYTHICARALRERESESDSERLRETERVRD